MSNLGKSPACILEECAGWENGHCVCLVENNFSGKCPFFKTREQVAKEKEYCNQRIAEILKGEVEKC